MKRLKAVSIILISGIAIVSSCQSNAARREANRKKATTDSVLYTLGLNNAEKEAILKSSRTKQMQQELEAFYNGKLVRSGFNGAMIVARKGVVIFEKYHGYENSRTKAPIVDSSAFQLASVSKTFTGAAVLWLVQKEQLSLDDSLQKFFPTFPYKGINVRMLLSHRSGLPNYLYFCDSLWKKESGFISNDEVIKLMEVHKPPMQHLPGTHFQYCNTNYLLLASIIEKVSGQKYADFMTQTIFKPLGMNSTFVFNPGSAVHAHQTQSHKYNGQFEPDTYFDGVMGDKGIYSSAEDMLKWDQALYSGQFLNEASLKVAYTPYSNEKPGVRNYGLGWRLMVYPDSTKNIVYHNGWWHGNNTVFYRFVQDSTTLIILGNKYNRGIYQAVKPIREILGHGDGEEAGEE
ncbi:CubicO group peptidase (beta-lactamase class C family) [Chitinophaga polysaccharea]|uniref:CubicO group peptidase (Beta-lactamase class C family) n=1 Tax=Chitinophaga polysaccharea TaxID=1293035 RepID=A0A561PWK3_9BACT|nr:serine hydrolase domain-containing protein [Chitinophaga polysaccharea]TWF42485.1 CubicO group peptidase (beta-lactamase class C family) [Chitinophaga polysaccharea]